MKERALIVLKRLGRESVRFEMRQPVPERPPPVGKPTTVECEVVSKPQSLPAPTSLGALTVHEGVVNVAVTRKPPTVERQDTRITSAPPAQPKQKMSKKERNKKNHCVSVNKQMAAFYGKDLDVIEQLNDASRKDWHGKMKKRKHEYAFITEKTQMSLEDVRAMSDKVREQEMTRLRLESIATSRIAAVQAQKAKRKRK